MYKYGLRAAQFISSSYFCIAAAGFLGGGFLKLF